MRDAVCCVLDCRNTLGEAPLWDGREQVLYWADVLGQKLYRLHPATGAVKQWDMPERLASFALREQGGMLMAFASGIAFYDLERQCPDWIARPEAHMPGNRCNDGKVDGLGRFWVGTMNESEPPHHTGALYRLDAGLTLHRIWGDIGIANGPVWSRENDRFWFTDSLDRQISVFDYDHAAGTIANRRIFADTAASGCTPDGATLDAEGFLWAAMWDGAKVVRFAPDGRVAREIRLPVSRPTSCMFGGADLRTLYVTSAAWGMAHEAQAGGLFALDAGVAGLPAPRFRG